MPARMSEVQCARCDGTIGTANRNADGLCGHCQREIGAHNPNSRAYRAWIAHGKRREIHRTPGGRPAPIGGEEALPRRHDLASVRTAELLAELRRRRDEAAQLLAIVPE